MHGIMEADMKTKEIILIGLFAALTAVGALINLPLGPVPFTLQLLFTFLAGALLGKKAGALSQLVYVLLGGIGLPVFANMSSGFGVVAGPTGGYIIGFIVGAFIIGLVIEFLQASKMINNSVVVHIIGILGGLVVVYIFGVFRLSFDYGFSKALIYGFYPFIGLDMLKATIAIAVVISVKKPLVKAGYLTV